MKIEVTQTVKDGVVAPLDPPVVKHVSTGEGQALIATGLAKEVFPEPIKHKPTVWLIRKPNDGSAPYVKAQCNCKNGMWQFTGLGPAAKLEVRHILCNREGLEANLTPGDYVSFGGWDSNLRPVKIVVEKAPKHIEQEYRKVYAEWAKQFARQPRPETPLDLLNKQREDKMYGKTKGPIIRTV
jgi:hypothetical protein